MESVSISESITRLCECIHQTHNVPAHSNSLRMLRSRTYSILLKSYSVEHDLWDGTSEVLAHSCVLHQQDEHKRLCTLLDQLPQEDTSVESVLHFLALMAGKGNTVPSSHNQTEVLMMPRIPKQRYQEFDLSMFDAPEEPRYLRYSNFPFDKDPGKGLSMLGSFGDQRNLNNWRSGMEDIHQQMVRVLSKPRDLVIPTAHVPTHDMLHYRDEGYGSPGDEQFRSLTISMTTGTEKKYEENMWDIVLKVQMPQQRTWEALGSLDPPKEKQSPIEAGPEALHRAWLANVALEQMYHKVAATQDILVPPVSRTEFVQDLKLLIMGFPSDTFQFNKKLQMFEMKKGVHIDGITAETLAKYSRDFIVGGTCCSRLWNLLSGNSVFNRSCKEQLMFQALFDSTQRYLKLHRAAAVSLPNDPLLHKLRQRFNGLYVQISCISQLLGIHPDLGTNEVYLPEGVKLLAHMYQQICRATSPDLACVLFFFFRSCCQVYFRLLEKWIFEGNCQQIHQEFFIQEVTDMMVCRTREYWSKGHVLLHDAVPSFLKNLAEIIFQCGKALNLLKLCCPKNPLCSVLRGGFPSLRCCLQGSELQELKAECNTFYQRALEVCGEPVDIGGIFTAVEEQEKVLQARAELLQKERSAKLQKEKQIRAEEVAKEKRQQLAALKEQMEEAAAQRDIVKQRELEEDRLLAQQYENEQQLIEEEKRRLVAHYASISQLVDQQRLQTEWQMKRIHLHDKRVDLLCALDNDMSLLGDDNNNAEQEPYDTENNNTNTNTETCFESLNDDAPTLEIPLQGPDSPHVPELPLQNPDSPHVPELPLQSPGSPHVPELPLQSPGSLHVLEFSLQNPDNFFAHESPLQSPGSPHIPELPLQSPDSSHVPKSPSYNPDSLSESSGRSQLNDFCRQQFMNAASARSRNKQRVLESEFDIITGDHREQSHHSVVIEAPSATEVEKTTEKPGVEILTALSDRDRNKQRVLESEFDILMGQHREEAQHYVVTEAPPLLATELEKTTEKPGVEILTALSDRDRNKQRVLESEFDILTGQHREEAQHYVVTEAPPLPATESEKTTEKPGVEILTALSDRDRNKQRVLESEFHILTGQHREEAQHYVVTEEPSPPAAEEEKTAEKLGIEILTALSDRDRNKQRVLESEFDILTGQHREEAQHSAVTVEPPPPATEGEKATEKQGVEILTALSDRDGNKQRVLESKFANITGQHREESQHSVVTEEPLRPATEEEKTTEKQGVEILAALPHRNYELPSGLGDLPMISVGGTALPDQLPSAAFNISTFDTSTVTATLQKSVMIPLEMQVKLVNSALIKYFLLELELVAHLSTLRSYFFLMDGEFSRSMTCVLFSRMAMVRSAAELLDCVALNSILARSLTLSSDPRAERFSFGVKYIPAGYSQSSPQLLDSITLQYQVAWPLNIILTEMSLDKYNDVFSFLLRLRRISWVLEEDFHLLKHIDAGVQNSYQYHCVQLHRYEMTHFVRALQNYVTSTAIQGSWVEFQRSLQRAQTLEDLYRTHVNYVKSVRFRCLLNKQCAGIQKALSDLFKMILKFHKQLSSHSWQQVSGTNEYRHPHFSTLEEIYTCFHNIAVFMFKFATKLANTGYLPHLWDLLQMLNINGFYPPYY